MVSPSVVTVDEVHGGVLAGRETTARPLEQQAMQDPRDRDAIVLEIL
jgi:hypothetical protein